MAERIENFSDDFITVPRDEWVYVEVPAETLMGDNFPPIQINGHRFNVAAGAASNITQAPPAYAEHVKVLIEGVQREAVRRLRPNKDIRALRQQASGGSRAAEAVEGDRSLITGRKVS